jgi:hypothetical protein
MFALILKFVAWLRQTKHTQTKVIPMADTVPVAPVSEPLLDKLKAILKTVGHDVEAVWDEAVALAKKAA